MCVCRNGKEKCITVAVLSFMLHLILLCLSITVLLVRIEDPLKDSKPLILKNAHGILEEKTLFALNGITQAFGILGIITSVMLMIGLKYKRPGYVIVFLCYTVLESILLLLSGILLCLKSYKILAVATVKLAVLGFSSLALVNRAYEDIMQDPSITRRNSISNVALLTEDFDDNDDISEVINPSRPHLS